MSELNRPISNLNNVWMLVGERVLSFLDSRLDFHLTADALPLHHRSQQDILLHISSEEIQVEAEKTKQQKPSFPALTSSDTCKTSA